MEAKLYGQNKGGMSINGIIKDYYAYAGEKISAGDLVEYVNGVAGKVDYGESVDTAIINEYASSYMTATKLGKNKAFIAHYKASNLYGIVVTINGATITYGTDTKLTTSDNVCQSQPSSELLNNGNIFIAYGKDTSNKYLYGMVVKITDNVIEVLIENQLSTTIESGYGISTCLLPNGNVFIAHYYKTNGYLNAMVCSISGATIISGADTQISAAAVYFSLDNPSSVLLPNGNVFVTFGYGKNYYYLYAIVCTVNDMSISKGAATQLSNSKHTGCRIKSLVLQDGNVLVTHSSTSGYNYLHAIVCSINSTTITKGTDKQLDPIRYSGDTPCALINIGNNKALIIHKSGTADSEAYLYGMIVTIDGTTITKETDTQLNPNESTGLIVEGLLLDNGTIFVAHSYNGTSYHLYAQIFGIDYDNNIPTNHIIATETETQVRKVTTGQFDGIAKTSGEGGDDTGHKDIVSIWTTPDILASLPVGALVKDVNSTFLGEPVIWKIADKNHEGYPEGSVTLISDKILAMRCFDAKEPNNSVTDRQSYGNNRYTNSNIRQWLNSDAEAGQWYSPKHDADQAPSADYVTANAYSDDAGFLYAFSSQFKNALLETTLRTVLTTVIAAGSSIISTDKIFLPSNTEVGLANENSIAEGSLLPIFSDDTSRIAYCTTEAIEDSDYESNPVNDTTAWVWSLRTPNSSKAHTVRHVSNSGSLSSHNAHAGNYGVRPLCNLSSSTMVSSGPDEDGCYRIIFK